MKRCEIYLADLTGGSGSEQGGTRPVLVVQNDTGNIHSTTTIVCPLTSKQKTVIGTHVLLNPTDCGILYESTVLCEQVRTVDKSRLVKRVGLLINKMKIEEINRKLRVSMGL